MVKCAPRNEKGMGIIEVVIAAAILVVVALGVSKWVTATFKTSKRSSDAASCNSTVQTVLGSIKSKDNSLRVRNWYPQNNTSFRAPEQSGDPFCAPGNTDRTALCDQSDILGTNATGNFDLSLLHNSLNVRSAATWATNFYNSKFPTQGCQPIVFTKTQISDLGNLLPDRITLPDWINEATVRISPFDMGSDTPLSCSGTWSGLHPDPAKNQGVQIALELKYQNSENLDQSCSGSITVGYGKDQDPPTIDRGGIQACGTTHGRGANIAVTCPNTGCPANFNLVLELGSTEPGSSFACRQTRPPAEADANLKPCTQYGTVNPIGSTGVNTKAGYNLSLGFKSSDVGKTYQYEWKAYDTSKNATSAVQTGTIRIAAATCPARGCGQPAISDGCGGVCPATPACPPPPPPPPPPGGGCSPDCPASKCGQDDGCGGKCPGCGGGGCVPNCPASQCGQIDGCGGNCPSCPAPPPTPRPGCTDDDQCIGQKPGCISNCPGGGCGQMCSMRANGCMVFIDTSCH